MAHPAEDVFEDVHGKQVQKPHLESRREEVWEGDEYLEVRQGGRDHRCIQFAQSFHAGFNRRDWLRGGHRLLGRAWLALLALVRPGATDHHGSLLLARVE